MKSWKVLNSKGLTMTLTTNRVTVMPQMNYIPAPLTSMGCNKPVKGGTETERIDMQSVLAFGTGSVAEGTRRSGAGDKVVHSTVARSCCSSNDQNQLSAQFISENNEPNFDIKTEKNISSLQVWKTGTFEHYPTSKIQPSSPARCLHLQTKMGEPSIGACPVKSGLVRP